MRLHVEPYASQSERLPPSGRHILAQFDDEAIVVYQAYRPAIGHWAAEHGHFGGEFSLARMSWIKTSFLWMMYRSGWAGKPGQEVILAIWLRRAGFEAILAEAVPSTFDPVYYPDEATWSAAVTRSTVRLQWDPDRTPGGGRLGRRAIQLGLRGQTLARYATEWILGIEDITDFLRTQAALVRSSDGRSDLLVPHAEVYWPANADTTARIGLTPDCGKVPLGISYDKIKALDNRLSNSSDQPLQLCDPGLFRRPARALQWRGVQLLHDPQRAPGAAAFQRAGDPGSGQALRCGGPATAHAGAFQGRRHPGGDVHHDRLSLPPGPRDLRDGRLQTVQPQRHHSALRDPTHGDPGLAPVRP